MGKPELSTEPNSYVPIYVISSSFGLCGWSVDMYWYLAEVRPPNGRVIAFYPLYESGDASGI